MSEHHDATRCVIVKPGDVLILSNVGDIDPGPVMRTLADLQQALGLRRIVIFEQDIEVNVHDEHDEWRSCPACGLRPDGSKAWPEGG